MLVQTIHCANLPSSRTKNSLVLKKARTCALSLSSCHHRTLLGPKKFCANFPLGVSQFTNFPLFVALLNALALLIAFALLIAVMIRSS